MYCNDVAAIETAVCTAVVAVVTAVCMYCYKSLVQKISSGDRYRSPPDERPSSFIHPAQW
jgi:hypothetical protein